MNNTAHSIKGLSDEFFNCTNDDQLCKVLNRFVTFLKASDKAKRDAFLNLSDKGLNRLLCFLKVENEDIRKLALRVVIELLGNNEILQNIFCEKYNFNPVGNVICINWLPSQLKSNITINEHVLYDIKMSQFIEERKRNYWMWPDNSKYTNEEMPDPEKYLLGLFYVNKSTLKLETKTWDDIIDIEGLIKKLEEPNGNSNSNILGGNNGNGNGNLNSQKENKESTNGEAKDIADTIFNNANANANANAKAKENDTGNSK